MKKRQEGFALFISMIILIILTFIGFGFASRGKVSSQVAKTSSRYEAVTAAAEDEMYRLLKLLAKTEGYIKTGNGVEDNGVPAAGPTPAIPATHLTQVWDNRKLAQNFNGNSRGLPLFSDFSNSGWRDNPVTQIINSEYGEIETQGFVQELIKKINPSNGEIKVQYLITVKAFAQNPGEETTATERESIAIQSLSEVRYTAGTP